MQILLHLFVECSNSAGLQCISVAWLNLHLSIQVGALSSQNGGYHKWNEEASLHQFCNDFIGRPENNPLYAL
jgi:hypothetical protein